MSRTLRTLALLSALLLGLAGASKAAATAEPAEPAASAEHAAHHPAASAASTPAARSPVDARLQAMREQRDKMAAAQTPAERQALMAAHMKAMQDGMQMMKSMSVSPAQPGMIKGGMPGMPAAMARQHQMMAERMEMMQTMMDMMMQRMAASESIGK